MAKQIPGIIVGIVLGALIFWAGWARASKEKQTIPSHSHPVLNEGENFVMEYPFLSDYFNQPMRINRAEWNAVRCMSELSGPMALSPELNMTNLIIMPVVKQPIVNGKVIEDGTLDTFLFVFVDTETQPMWQDMYLGEGKFDVSDEEVRTQYLKTIDTIFDALNRYFPENTDITHKPNLSRTEVEIQFRVYGNLVGSWRKGHLMLKDEQKPDWWDLAFVALKPTIEDIIGNDETGDHS